LMSFKRVNCYAHKKGSSKKVKVSFLARRDK